MSDRYEVAIVVLDENYVDTLIVSLVRQGYDVYYNAEDKKVCYTMDGGELTKLNIRKET
jgi:hypothetical protein